MKESSRPRAFKCIDIYQSAEDATWFEIVVGTVDGQIFYAELEYTKNLKEGSIAVVEPFTFMLELVDAKAILDIKIASFSYE